MPEYSIEQWRAAVGTMAAIAASKREHQRIHKRKEFQTRRTKCAQNVLWIVILFFIRPHSLMGDEDTVPIEYHSTTETQKLAYSPNSRRVSKSSLLLVLVAALVVAEVSPFMVEMLLMMSGDVEPNPGPTKLTDDDLPRLVEILHPARHKWEEIAVQLHIDEGTRACLRDECSTNEKRLLRMLEKWLHQIEPPPLLEHLITALCRDSVGCSHLVQGMKDEFCPQLRAEKNGTDETCQPNGNVCSETTTELENKGQQYSLHDHQGSKARHHSGWSESTLEPDVVNPPSVETLEEKQLQAIFNALLSKTHEMVKAMDFNTFNTSLLSLATVKKWNKRFDMKELFPRVELTTPTNEVWDQLSPHINFLDVSLLKCVIEISGSNLKCELDEYTKWLSLFITTPKPTGYKTTRQKIEVVLNKPFERVTYEDIELSREHLTSHCSLPEFAVAFGYFDQKSTNICFFATTSTVYHLLSDELPLLKSEAHQRMGKAIAYVTINKMTCYHCNHEYDYNTESALERVETRFQCLVTRTESEVRRNNATTFWDKFSSLPVCHRWHQKFILGKLLHASNDIKTMWAHMKFYINFLNYGLLEHAIKVIDNKDLMREMEECKHEIDLFRSRTKLCDFIACWPDPDTEPPEQQLQEVVKLKVNRSWEECTLRDLEEAKQTLTSRFFLPDFAVFLEKIYKNSVRIILRTTTNVARIFRDELVQTSTAEVLTFNLVTERGIELSCEPAILLKCESVSPVHDSSNEMIALKKQRQVYFLLQEYEFIYQKYKHVSELEKPKYHTGGLASSHITVEGEEVRKSVHEEEGKSIEKEKRREEEQEKEEQEEDEENNLDEDDDITPGHQFADTSSHQHHVPDSPVLRDDLPMHHKQIAATSQHLSDVAPLQLPPNAIVEPTAAAQLGYGSYGVVFEVKYEEKCFAAKKYYERYAQSAKLKDIFDREKGILSKLNHPNIVPYFGVCQLSTDGSQVIVMERLETNFAIFMEHRNPALETRISIMRDIAHGLAYVHSQDPIVIHRDLTATNVLVTAGGTAKIGDFSKSCLRSVTTTPELLTSKPGTTDYMPPEAMEGNVYDDKLDVFSFGHLSIYAIIQHRPHPLLRPVYTKDGQTFARSELERRHKFIDEARGKLKENDSPFLLIVKTCLNDESEKRPAMKDILMRSWFY